MNKPAHPDTGHPEVFEAPFVGNACVDDNLNECVKLAIWKAQGLAASASITVRVHGDVAALYGVVASEAVRLGAEAAAREVEGIAQVDNHLRLAPAS